MRQPSTRQRDVFLAGEGDASHRRREARVVHGAGGSTAGASSRSGTGTDPRDGKGSGAAQDTQRSAPSGSAAATWLAQDPIGSVILGLGIHGNRILEVGARSGDRLAALGEHFGADRAAGVEPSKEAIEAGLARHPALELHRGTADALPFFEDAFDLVVVSLCLSLCDPGDLFRIAAELDRVLKLGGHLVIYDYWPDAPHRRPYKHREGIYCIKMDYAELFRWHPAYEPIHVELFAFPPERAAEREDRVAVQVLHRGQARLPLVD